MSSDTTADIILKQLATFVIRVDGFSPERPREQCRVTFLDAETSSIVATQSFDVGFVRQTSVRQLMNIMSVGYRYRSHRMEQATRALHLTTRGVSRALASGKRETRLKDSMEDANCS